MGADRQVWLHVKQVGVRDSFGANTLSEPGAQEMGSYRWSITPALVLGALMATPKL